MSVSGSKAKLRTGLKDLRIAWDRVQQSWDDPVSRRFEARFIEPLEKAVRSATNAMDQMEETINRIKSECQD